MDDFEIGRIKGYDDKDQDFIIKYVEDKQIGNEIIKYSSIKNNIYHIYDDYDDLTILFIFNDNNKPIFIISMYSVMNIHRFKNIIIMYDNMDECFCYNLDSNEFGF